MRIKCTDSKRVSDEHTQYNRDYNLYGIELGLHRLSVLDLLCKKLTNEIFQKCMWQDAQILIEILINK